MSRINWPQLMHAGLHQRGLQPEQFWSLTPAELMMMLGVQAGVSPMTRTNLDALIKAFPDEEAKGSNHG